MVLRLSIVVITYMDKEGLAATLESLTPLTSDPHAELEVIVVDGGTPGIDDVTLPAKTQLWSAPDEGIYDAMNKGLSLSRGSHVWFLNGGDRCLISAWADVRRVLSPDALVLGAYELAFEGRVERRASRRPWYIWHALPTSHQAILFPGKQARAAMYDLSYAVAGDYEFTARVMTMSDVRIEVIPDILAQFQVGGTSLVHGEQVAIDAERVQREVLGAGKIRRLISSLAHRLSLARRRAKVRKFS